VKAEIIDMIVYQDCNMQIWFPAVCSKNDREDQKVSKCRSRFWLWQSFLVVLLLAGMAPRKRQRVRFDARTGFLL